MMHDIYATAMGGDYQTHRADQLVEMGTWNYRGYGNAEIAMEARGRVEVDSVEFDLMIHSAERQLDTVALTSRHRDGVHSLRASIAGHLMDVAISDPGHDTSDRGRISIPEESVFDGHSPVWMIHLMMTGLPPDDRTVTTPVIRIPLLNGDREEQFFRFSRQQNHVQIERLTKEGKLISTGEIVISEDGCPTSIREGDTETIIVRHPHVPGR